METIILKAESREGLETKLSGQLLKGFVIVNISTFFDPVDEKFKAVVSYYV